MLEYDKGRLRNFPHIYYVNLDNRRDRRVYMEDQFQQWRLEYTRVSSSKYAESKVGEWSHKIDGKCKNLPVYVVGNAITHLEFMKDNTEWFESVEIAKMERVRDYMYQNPVSEEKIKQGRRDFYSFFKENDVRLGTDLLKTFPMYKDFYEYCKGIYETYDK